MCASPARPELLGGPIGTGSRRNTFWSHERAVFASAVFLAEAMKKDPHVSRGCLLTVRLSNKYLLIMPGQKIRRGS
jgi:hypothetical protein